MSDCNSITFSPAFLPACLPANDPFHGGGGETRHARLSNHGGRIQIVWLRLSNACRSDGRSPSSSPYFPFIGYSS